MATNDEFGWRDQLFVSWMGRPSIRTPTMFLCPNRTRVSSVKTSCVSPNCEPGVTIEQIAKDFGVHPMTLQKWLRRADIDTGAKPGQTRTEPLRSVS